MIASETTIPDRLRVTSQVDPDNILSFTYTNHRGETQPRRVIGSSAQFRYGTSEWHDGAQWFLLAFDLNKQAWRDFQLSHIKFN